MPEIEEQTEEEKAAELVAVDEAQKAEADAEAELSAGFTGVDPTPTEATPPLVEGEPVIVPEPVVPEPVVEPVLAKISEAQFQDVLNKANSVEDVRAAFAKYQRDAGGRIGGLEETIKQIKAAAQGGQPLAVTEQDLEEVSKEYPDLAKAIAKDLAKVFGKAKAPTPVATPEPVVNLETQVVPLVDERVTKVTQTIAERRSLEIAQEIGESYPDWRTITGPKDSVNPYRTWLHAQGEGYELLVLNSNAPSTIVKSIDKFKAFELAEKAKKPATPVVGKNARSERLLEAVPAKGGGGSPPKPRQLTPEEEMAEGFVNK